MFSFKFQVLSFKNIGEIGDIGFIREMGGVETVKVVKSVKTLNRWIFTERRQLAGMLLFLYELWTFAVLFNISSHSTSSARPPTTNDYSFETCLKSRSGFPAR